ncbi:MAG: hydantoinase/oxoprolinase family protein, partial [Pseudomonadales bacterium]
RPLLSRSFEVDRSYRFKKGSGLPVRIPVIEMVEIGAGGGSLASVDRLGRLQVGPESAGSEPGPACYGRGGQRPAVTDADVLLGRIDPETFADGRLALDLEAARRAMDDQVGAGLGMSAVEAAYAVSEVVNENMAAAARAHLGEWGRDARDRTLIAFGGAAPLHACHLARKLKLPRVVIPANAGVGSAVGFLLAPVGFEVVRSLYMRLDELDAGLVARLMDDMRREALDVVGAVVAEDRLVARRRAFMRYLGQGYEIAVDLDEAPERLSSDALRARFEENYAALYGRVIPGLEVEILSWTLNLAEAEPRYSLPPESVSRERRLQARTHTALFDVLTGTTVDAACHERADLVPGDYVVGPALIREAQTTVVVGTGFSACVGSRSSLVLVDENLEGDS